MSKNQTKTFCRICAAFCGLDVETDGDKIVKISPDKSHPYSWRDFCSKGANAGNVRDHPKRLRTPMKRVGNSYVSATYEEAIADIAKRLTDIKEKHDANAIATYQGNPGATNTKGSMFQAGFMAGLGSANKYTVGSIDQNNFHVVGEKMYGCSLTVLNPDVDNAKCMLLLGMNPAVSGMCWLETAPNGWKRMLKAQNNGADLIIVDPRETPSTKKAKTHIKITPGEDWALLLAMIKVIFAQGWVDQNDCDDANGVADLQTAAESASMDYLSQRCGVSVVQIEDIAQRFATVETAFCAARTGVAHTRNGTLGEWLSHALNLITGRIDKKGGRYYQRGILENTMALLASMSPPEPRRSRIGNYPAVAGAYPLATLPEEITTPGKDQIRALIINSGNPVTAGPEGDKLDSALAQLDLLVAIDFFQRESHRHADWLIPGCHFLEREDALVMLSTLYDKPFFQFGQATISPINGIKEEWEFFLDLALAMNVPFMGKPIFNRITKISRFVAKLTGNPKHAFNPRWLWAMFVKKSGRVTWKEIISKPQGWFYEELELGHFRSSLQTPDGKIQAAPKEFIELLTERLTEPLATKNEAYPLRLVNQRRTSMMNSWLVESNHHHKVYGDYIEINPTDAAAQIINHEQSVTVQSDVGSVTVKAFITEDVPVGIVSMDHGWGSRLFDPQGGAEPERQGTNRNLLVGGKVLDELAGTPEFNCVNVKVQAVI